MEISSSLSCYSCETKIEKQNELKPSEFAFQEGREGIIPLCLDCWEQNISTLFLLNKAHKKKLLIEIINTYALKNKHFDKFWINLLIKDLDWEIQDESIELLEKQKPIPLSYLEEMLPEAGQWGFNSFTDVYIEALKDHIDDKEKREELMKIIHKIFETGSKETLYKGIELLKELKIDIEEVKQYIRYLEYFDKKFTIQGSSGYYSKDEPRLKLELAKVLAKNPESAEAILEYCGRYFIDKEEEGPEERLISEDYWKMINKYEGLRKYVKENESKKKTDIEEKIERSSSKEKEIMMHRSWDGKEGKVKELLLDEVRINEFFEDWRALRALLKHWDGTDKEITEVLEIYFEERRWRGIKIEIEQSIDFKNPEIIKYRDENFTNDKNPLLQLLMIKKLNQEELMEHHIKKLIRVMESTKYIEIKEEANNRLLNFWIETNDKKVKKVLIRQVQGEAKEYKTLTSESDGNLRFPDSSQRQIIQKMKEKYPEIANIWEEVHLEKVVAKKEQDLVEIDFLITIWDGKNERIKEFFMKLALTNYLRGEIATDQLGEKWDGEEEKIYGILQFFSKSQLVRLSGRAKQYLEKSKVTKNETVNLDLIWETVDITTTLLINVINILASIWDGKDERIKQELIKGILTHKGEERIEWLKKLILHWDGKDTEIYEIREYHTKLTCEIAKELAEKEKEIFIIEVLDKNGSNQKM